MFGPFAGQLTARIFPGGKNGRPLSENRMPMSGIVEFLKGFFKRSKKSHDEPSPDELRALFRSRYLDFRTVLNANNAVLEVMSDMQRTLLGSQSFGMAFIRAGCTAISVNVFKMIQNVNAISSHRYEVLYDIFDTIHDAMKPILSQPNSLPGGEPILPLEVVNKDMADQVGSKMATLGEIKNRLRFPVPDGFVVTAASERLFMSHNRLQEEIDRRLQLLDPEDLSGLHKASAAIQELIIYSPLPPALDQALGFAYQRLEKKAGKTGLNVSLRTSIVGEEETRTSFAGHYRSILNVGGKNISHAYQEVLATKYAPEALIYRLHAGFRDEDIVMCAGVMAMVDAVAGGVMYCRDPNGIRKNVVTIHAVWGLSKPVMDGTTTWDVFVVSKETRKRIVKKEIMRKEDRFVCLPREGICLMKTAGENSDAPSITDEQALTLATLATDLEAYYGKPKEIEWSIDTQGRIHILQVRAMRDIGPESIFPGDKSRQKAAGSILVQGGQTASPGVAGGPAFFVDNNMDLQRFAPGGVLVVKHGLARWTALLGRAVAVVSDHGSIAGDLATVCMEMKIPALFNMPQATAHIPDGAVVTVDADGSCVYAGKPEGLVGEDGCTRANPMKGSPVYDTLEAVLKQIAPLNLTDPEDKHFVAEQCKTLHDISRFCHEKSVKEMFGFGKEHYFPERTSKQLVCEIPMRWWVMDLDDGFKVPVMGDAVALGNIVSVPMLAIWEGITAVPWKGPPPVDTKGFLSVMFRSTMDPSLVFTRRSPYAEKNYVMISKHFCDLTCRFGYHLAGAQAFINDRAKENYVAFGYRGGGADFDRRVLRLRLIEQILKTFDFRIQVEKDFMSARIEGYGSDFLLKRLKVLGYLIMHTRQLDMVMTNKRAVNYYLNEQLKEIHECVLYRDACRRTESTQS